MLTIIWVAPECRGTVGPASLCHGTLAGENTYMGDERVHEKKGIRDISSLTDLRPTC
jgi:hypothetical protein